MLRVRPEAADRVAKLSTVIDRTIGTLGDAYELTAAERIYAIVMALGDAAVRIAEEREVVAMVTAALKEARGAVLS